MTARGAVPVVVAAVVLGLWTAVDAALVSAGAAGLLRPSRRPVAAPAPDGCVDETFSGKDVRLAGWRCAAAGAPRGSIVYLHGVGDTRASARGSIHRLRAKGFDVVAYDSRAHGESDGDACTYGYYEKEDLAAVVATLGDGPVFLVGVSLGAAVALQYAGTGGRVEAVVAAETFSDLRAIAAERAPFFFSGATIERAFATAGRRGRFSVDDVSPVRAAARITVPVFLVHGANDTDTPVEHSRRVFAALRGEKRLRVVDGASHGRSLTGEVWAELDEWLMPRPWPRALTH